ncbi:MarR family winged helix-turn-helix transcriptional regulator [Lentilactobacillus sunkii]|uniref:Regulatory protein MarR n=1 Tax=Lentilactobacillus sunkii DSM 19904 TaxID=1423808 RepID=A0A0R1L7E7_9LACO|nr:MarR family transcriptional regulator [Lentilactobacillus sunkii]KRK88330.1 regulatory protein MarR [Lentilactobacillus sunkii DSM 19904]
MKRKNSIEIIREQLEAFRTHDIDDHILELINQNQQIDSNTTAEMTINDLHVMRAVQSAEGIKISEIVEQVPLTQGAVSKVVNKLASKGLVEKFHQPTNKKESFVRLTETGKAINQIHTNYHLEEENQLEHLADHYSKDELEKFANFMSELNEIREKI